MCQSMSDVSASVLYWKSCSRVLRYVLINFRSADWIEHVIATKGEPYLRIPEDEMSLISSGSLRGVGIIAACSIFLVLIAAAALASRLLLRMCKRVWLELRSRSAVHGVYPASDRAHQE